MPRKLVYYFCNSNKRKYGRTSYKEPKCNQESF